MSTLNLPEFKYVTCSGRKYLKLSNTRSTTHEQNGGCACPKLRLEGSIKSPKDVVLRLHGKIAQKYELRQNYKSKFSLQDLARL